MTKFFFYFLSFISFAYAQTVVPIANLRNNNSSGVPVDSGSIVIVEGIATCTNHYGNNGPGAIQDLTAGISVYGSMFANAVQIGDSIQVKGFLTHFSGLTQIDLTKPGGLVTVRSSNKHFDTIVVTIAQIKAQQWNGYEEFESRIIRINNVTISGSGNFASGTNYNITDATGSLSSGFRIDNDVTSIIGTPIPTGQVDVVGILGQFDNSRPYSSGYQILPRKISDIIYDGSPVILNPVLAANITTSSFTVYFTTARKGNSQVKYGLTPALEIDSVVINNDTTDHVVQITGLQPSTNYYFKAISKNSIGTSSSDIKTVFTASLNPSAGAINVYFNFQVDTTVSIPGNAAKGSINITQKLIDRINLANYSIDLALYSFFGMPDVASALVVAKNRGVKVRVVYDSRTTQNSMQTLIDAGIPVSKRPTSLDGIMHNKFFIFDARDTLVTNDVVWTGSFNVTSTEAGWKNNIVEIEDAGVASAYLNEFNEMFGSSGDVPNSSAAKFGNQKSNNTSHNFVVNGKSVKVYFSPSDGTTSQIISAVNSSNYSNYFAMYAFTRSDIQNAMYSRFSAGANDIRGIIDQVNTSGSQYNALAAYAQMFESTSPTQHHKYCIVDASFPASNPTVITGSHNWSNAAEQDNDENTLFIDDIYIANQFMQEFKKRYNEAGGTGTFIIPVVGVKEKENLVDGFYLHQNYPNPFNPVTTIKIEVSKRDFVSLKVFDVLGKEVATLFSGEVEPGIIAVDFNSASFNNISSGIYYYKLATSSGSVVRKMMMVK